MDKARNTHSHTLPAVQFETVSPTCNTNSSILQLTMPPKRPATSPAKSPSVPKKTRKSLTLEAKLDIIHRHERGEKTNSIARHHGHRLCLPFSRQQTLNGPRNSPTPKEKCIYEWRESGEGKMLADNRWNVNKASVHLSGGKWSREKQQQTTT